MSRDNTGHVAHEVDDGQRTKATRDPLVVVQEVMIVAEAHACWRGQ